MTFRSALVLLGVGFVVIQRTQGSLLPTESISFSYPTIVEANGLSNIRIEYHSPIDGHLAIHYGDCKESLSHPSLAHHSVGSTYVGKHHLASRHEHWTDQRPERFVWIIPESIANGGCLHAYSGEDLIGTSEPITVVKRKERRGIALADIAEVEGPWFDGVEYLKQKEPDSVFVAKAKAQRIGILGGGMSGLMTSHLLESVAIHNWTIIESTGRVGGRVHTSYLNNTTPDEYQYQEMGPMRFPVSITYPQNGETIEIKDHKMVFQLAATLNEINGYDPALSVDFIEWIQNSANAPVDTDKRRPDGTVPGNAEVAANSSLAPTPAQVDNATAVTVDGDAIVQWQTLNVTNITEMANNIFRAHKKAIDAGYLSWSEAAYLRYHLNATLNVTDEIDDLWDAYDNWLYDNEYFSATTWRTIDKGLSRLPAAFAPLVSNKTLFNSVVNELSWNEATQKMTVFYKPRNASWAKSSSIKFDYVVTAVPFTKVRLWRMPAYSSLLSRAINRYSYDPACKVAILYKTRFWEHLEYPIIGGCGAVNVTPIGEICYPSYKINSTGPGVLLASYIEIDAFTQSLQALSDSDHVALVQRAMVDVHGEVANEQFTGIYDRVCWGTMPDQAGAWLGPVSGQQQLYLPAFFNTEMHTIFVGEHTSYVHAWIWSALESAVRGTTQLLLEMGLVDEAKQITETWMARWLTL